MRFLYFAILLSAVTFNIKANSVPNSSNWWTCDNITNGGTLGGDEDGYGTSFDPGLITNLVSPSGGTGVIEYMWISSTVNPFLQQVTWDHIPNSGTIEFDPGVITQTTWYQRCSRRAGCTEWAGETNIIVKRLNPFPPCRVLTPGSIAGGNQSSCLGSLDPSAFTSTNLGTGNIGTTIGYEWYKSSTNASFPTGWSLIPSSNLATYDSPLLTQTTYFLRKAYGGNCVDSFKLSNIISVIIGNPIDLAVNVYPEKCPGGNGAIKVIATGVGPFTYRWNTGATTDSISNLSSGIYDVTVYDPTGCSSAIATIFKPLTDLNINVTVTQPNCLNPLGSAQVLPNNPTHIYRWSSGSTTNSQSNLSPGTYRVTVQDANGCVDVDTFSINPAQNNLACSITPTSNFNGFVLSKWGANDGKLRVDITGGNPQFSVMWSNNATTNEIVNLAAGTYSVTVTDRLGCTCISTYTINNPCKIGDFVWLDTDRNGRQGPTEIGLAGIPIKLTGLNNLGQAVTLNTTTDADGKYCFEPLLPGSYMLEFTRPANYVTSVKNNGDPALDSDIDPTTNKTGMIVLTNGQRDITIDAGFYPYNPNNDCQNVTNGGVIGNSQELCGPGTPNPLFNIQLPSGGVGTLEYMWMKSNSFPIFTGPNDPNWTPVPSSNTPGLAIGNLDRTTYFIRCSRRSNCNDFIGESNVITITIKPIPIARINFDRNTPKCTGQRLEFSASDAGVDAVYSWDFGRNANLISQVGTDATVSFSTPNPSIKIYLTVSLDGCLNRDSITIQVINCNSPRIASVYPTIVENSLNIKKIMEVSEEISVEIVNLQGALIQRIQLPKDFDFQSFILSDMPQGMYLVRMKMEDGHTQVDKIIKN
jgi:hypothetical protein